MAGGAGATPTPGWAFERRLWQAGHTPVAGVDEAGRGALAGPIVAAVVLLPPGEHPFRDSKQVPEDRRDALAADVRACAVAWSVGRAEADEIDALGVPAATRRAVRRALAGLPFRPGGLVTDWLDVPGPWAVLAPARADQRSLQAAAASLLAKTERDRWMRERAEADYPLYGFARHKGYGAPRHLRALHDHGPCPIHRRRFAPVAQATLFRP
jgi:ribonuclease HII